MAFRAWDDKNASTVTRDSNSVTDGFGQLFSVILERHSVLPLVNNLRRERLP